jgi:hypothetical protein
MESTKLAAEIDRARGATDPQTVYVRSDGTLTQGELAPQAQLLEPVKGVEQVSEPVLTRGSQGRRAGRGARRRVDLADRHGPR